jgi:DNA-directed RNA polymerase specialized sigma24 family protein
VTESADANLVAAALKGDAESFSRLCEQYYPALVAVAYSQLSDRGLAEDAAQEALLTA